MIEQDVAWFLSGGTLLGAYREGDFIPWDWDVEITVLSEESRPKLETISRNLEKCGFRIIKTDDSIENLKIVASGWGAIYEILGRRLSPQGFRERKLTRIPAEFFSASVTVNLRGVSFPAPSPVEGFLSYLYGDWSTPKRTRNKSKYLSKDALIVRRHRSNG